MNSESLERLRKESYQLRPDRAGAQGERRTLRPSGRECQRHHLGHGMNSGYAYLSPSAERQSGCIRQAAMVMTLEKTFAPASVEAIQRAFS